LSLSLNKKSAIVLARVKKRVFQSFGAKIMGLFSFMASAGAKLFGGKKPSEIPNLSDLIAKHVASVGLPKSHLHYWLEGETMVVSGWVDDKPTKEKVVLAVGNVEGVDKVADRIVVGPAPVFKKAVVAEAPVVAAVAAPVVVAAAPPAEALPSAEELAKQEEWTSKSYTVVKGDTLSKIAKEFYGNANKYPLIFEANKPMLSHPDKIYPGQMLRIPPLDDK
jgi:LysM repeat protein